MKQWFKQVVAMIFFAGAIFGTVSAQEIAFEPKDDSLDWTKVQARAKELNRLVFVEIYSDSVKACQVMDVKTLTDNELSSYFTGQFVNIRVNADQPAGKAFAKKYNVNCYPNFLWFDQTGTNLLHRAAGFHTVKDFLALAEACKNPSVNTYSALQNEYNAGNPTSEFMWAYLKALSENCFPTNNLAVKFLGTQKEGTLSVKDNWHILRDFVTDIDAAPFKYLIGNMKEFSDKFTKDSVNEKIFTAYLDHGRELIYVQKVDKDKFEAYKKEVGKVVFDRSAELALTLELSFADGTADWPGYYKAAKDLVKKIKEKDGAFLNTVSRKLFEKSDDKKQLTDALQWSKKAVDLKGTPANLDTYANLLFKTGDKAMAITTETKALEMVKNEGQDPTEFDATLKKFSEAK